MNKTAHADLTQMRAGSYGGSADYIDHILFDTQAISTTVTDYSYFTTPYSGTKTLQATNMSAAGQLPQGQEFIVKAIACRFIPIAISALSGRVQSFYRMLEFSTVEMIVQGRQFDFQAPGSLWLPNVSAAEDVTGTQGVQGTRVGDFNFQGYYKLRVPIVLSPLVSFRLSHKVATTSDAAGCGSALTILTTTLTSQIQWKLIGGLNRSK